MSNLELLEEWVLIQREELAESEKDDTIVGLNQRVQSGTRAFVLHVKRKMLIDFQRETEHGLK
jgi:hypothetical protein